MKFTSIILALALALPEQYNSGTPTLEYLGVGENSYKVAESEVEFLYIYSTLLDNILFNRGRGYCYKNSISSEELDGGFREFKEFSDYSEGLYSNEDYIEKFRKVMKYRNDNYRDSWIAVEGIHDLVSGYDNLQDIDKEDLCSLSYTLTDKLNNEKITKPSGDPDEDGLTTSDEMSLGSNPLVNEPNELDDLFPRIKKSESLLDRIVTRLKTLWD